MTIANASNSQVLNYVCQGRLTLTSGDPLGLTDVTGGSTIYFTPYLGEFISLYNGTIWETFSFAELSLAIPAVANTVHDIFAYSSSGNVLIEALAWTNDTTRAVGVNRQNGVLCKIGDTTRRYIGTFRTLASGRCDDNLANRLVWNYHNRISKRMFKAFNAASWTYTSSTWRQCNASTTNQLTLVCGQSNESSLYMFSKLTALGSTSNLMFICINQNGTAAFGSNSSGSNKAIQSNYADNHVDYFQSGGIGYSFYATLERATAGTGTPTHFATYATHTVGSMNGIWIC